MGYQALLFCPDEKTARTLTQVLGELEFSVEPCTETFAAVKRLMGEHFDAVVVDCDNEQNATLLFKSARNSTSNQSSLAVAVVEGQAGVAKAFRIGANLVLTKPINVEQAKGTLRVARGLLRKGDTGKPVVPAATTPTPPTQRPAAPLGTAPSVVAPPSVSASLPLAPRPAAVPPQPQAVAKPSAAPTARPANFGQNPAITSSPVPSSAPSTAKLPIPAAAVQTPAIPAARPASRPAASITPAASIPAASAPLSSSFASSGAASAPAPAREVPPPAIVEAPVAPVEAASEILAASAPATAAETISSSTSMPAPSFTFGGANEPEASGGSKKILIAVAAVVLVGAILYGGYGYLGGRSSEPASQTAAVPARPASVPSTSSPATSAPAASASAVSTPDLTLKSAPQPATEAATPSSNPGATETTSNETGNVSSNPAKENHKSSSAAADAPLMVKGGAAPKVKAQPAPSDPVAPSLIGMAAVASSGPPPDLVGSGKTATPVLQKLSISQGVSQGLLVKKVEPVYPTNAIHLHVEGAVQLSATISKSGDITDVKILSGDQQLTRAAADAVKRWKYKPYLLNGEPVEIQTQITINFRLPH
jgi:TonB family protein